MNYMKYSKTTQLSKNKVANVVICILLIMVFLSGCGQETYSISTLDFSALSDAEKMNYNHDLEELYDYIQTRYDEYVIGHELVQIQGEISFSDNGNAVLDFIQFSFFQYIDDSREGGNVSVIYIETDFKESPIIEVKEFLGAGKACNVPSVPLLNQTDTFRDVIKTLETELKKVEGLKKEFRIWRTFNTTSDGNLKVSVYSLE